MSRAKPEYFDEVEKQAADRWRVLEADSVLRGPWDQLFKQIKSPQHVLSELLQNADDAGAMSAAAWLDGNRFVFEHDGRDFSRSDFEALCAFGSSNKANALSIGFRGIGFKSTFSLGHVVEILSPSLSVRFEDSRFTLPIWQPATRLTDSRTRFSVDCKDGRVVSLMRRQLDSWLKDALPLVFFSNLRELRIGETAVRVEQVGEGPVPGSRWVDLIADRARRLLIVDSEEEELPEECKDEIKDERRGGEQLQIPAMRTTLVLDEHAISSKLYAVLPAGPMLPGKVSVQAPFMQNAARDDLKDPGVSPLNRWLLDRAGHLLARTLLGWVGNETLPEAERANAYKLLMAKPAQFAPDVQGSVLAELVEAIEDELEDKPLLLCADGAVENAENVAFLPDVLFRIWEPKTLSALFNRGGRIGFPGIGDADRKDLCSWDCSCQEVDLAGIWDICAGWCESDEIPNPLSTEGTVALWNLLVKEHNERQNRYPWMRNNNTNLMSIVSIPSKNGYLIYPRDVLFQSDIPDEATDDEINLIINYKSESSPGIEKLVEMVRIDIRDKSVEEISSNGEDSGVAFFLKSVKLDKKIDKKKLIRDISERIFSVYNHDSIKNDTLIATKFIIKNDIVPPNNIVFICKDGIWRRKFEDIYPEYLWWMKELLPKDFVDEHIISFKYEKLVGKNIWRDWSNKNIKIPCFPLPVEEDKYKRFDSICKFYEWLKENGLQKPESLTYKKYLFEYKDYNWDKQLLDFFYNKVTDNSNPRYDIFSALLDTWKPENDKLLEVCHFYQISQQNGHKEIDIGSMPASWVVRLRRGLQLPDDKNEFRAPSDMLLRTQETKDFVNLQPFLREDLDRPDARGLLKALGVRDSVSDPSSVLNRLRGLTHAENPLLLKEEIRKQYALLDRMVSDHDAASEVKNAFGEEPFVLTDRGWMLAAYAFRENELRIPGVGAVDEILRSFQRLLNVAGITEEPGRKDALSWLKAVPHGRIAKDNLLAARQVIAEYPDDVADDLGVWLSVSGELLPIREFEWSSAKLGQKARLFPNVTGSIADIGFLKKGDSHRGLPSSIAGLPSADERLEKRLRRQGDSKKPDAKSAGQLKSLGAVLSRCRFEHDKSVGEESANNDRAVGRDLQETVWRIADDIRFAWFLEGAQASEDENTDALWSRREHCLYTSFEGPGITTALEAELSYEMCSRSAQDFLKRMLFRDAEYIEDYAKSESLIFESEADAPGESLEDSDGRIGEGDPGHKAVGCPAGPVSGKDLAGPKHVVNVRSGQSDQLSAMPSAPLTQSGSESHPYFQDGFGYEEAQDADAPEIPDTSYAEVLDELADCDVDVLETCNIPYQHEFEGHVRKLDEIDDDLLERNGFSHGKNGFWYHPELGTASKQEGKWMLETSLGSSCRLFFQRKSLRDGWCFDVDQWELGKKHGLFVVAPDGCYDMPCLRGFLEDKTITIYASQYTLRVTNEV